MANTRSLLNNLVVDLEKLISISRTMENYNIKMANISISRFDVTREKNTEKSISSLDVYFFRSLESSENREIKCYMTITTPNKARLKAFKSLYSIGIVGVIKARAYDLTADIYLMNALFAYMRSIVLNSDQLSNIVGNIIDIPDSLECLYTSGDPWLLTESKGFCWSSDMDTLREKMKNASEENFLMMNKK